MKSFFQVLALNWENPQVFPIFIKTWEKLGRKSGRGKTGVVECQRFFVIQKSCSRAKMSFDFVWKKMGL